MEQVRAVTDELAKVVAESLNRIQGLTDNPEINELCDTIRLNTEAHLTEIKGLVTNKVRLREMTILPTNIFHKYQSRIVVFIHGRVKHPRTNRAKAAASVIWAPNHSINLTIDNPLSVKSKENTTLYGTLAMCNQMIAIGIKNTIVFTVCQNLGRSINRLPLHRARGFKDDNGEDVPNANLYRRIDSIIEQNDLKIKILETCSELFQPTFDSIKTSAMEETAKRVDLR